MHRATHPLLEEILERLEGAYSQATIRAYRADFENFVGYCEENHRIPLPSDATAVSGFIAEMSTIGVKSASIRRAVSGISTVHRLNRMEDPTKDPEVTLAMRRMHRTLGRAAKQAKAIDTAYLKALLAACDHSLRGLRNQAMLKIGFDTLSRRSELISLNVEDLRPRKILLRRSKTDPYGVGRWLSFSAEGDRILNAWIQAAGITEGAVFRGIDQHGDLTERLDPGQVNRIMKRLARKANLDYEVISGHSLRVGAAQDLLLKGASLPTIMQRGRWSSPETMMRYLESAPAADLEDSSDGSELTPLPNELGRFPR